ncbi:zinc-binding dehydrogenase [Pseudonocardia kunmingensis]|uniref:D-arabinose 1-dehydrogenase-like Zn-dependent alcohol dehydrogenase n=1 Tax=Pseudonocardia kunmingensis TaxID=630975 RepID=A0A543CXN0_9PSEU|nr:zinc-binding dehydrogenase [Pseudonocardia kunmingensis]TQM01854.1 D-arabinose 1-dehydrogenase-like Zn-dependent alcohol dehydrogenase [Pseudonocardia kunmingensis]
MRAAVATRISADDPVAGVEIVDVPEPEAGPGQALVTVEAVSLNHHDLWTLRGVGVSEERLPVVLGSDVAGVTADGREVVVHSLVADPERGGGDELLDPRRGMLADALQGGLATTVAVPARNLVDKPASLSFEEAACMPTAWLTAYRMLFVRGAARPGQTVLVQGAGGGVATAAVTLATAAGLRVWVTGRSPEKREKVRALGADAVFETGARLPERVDVVIDTVGHATWEHSLRSVRPGGTVVVAGATAGAVVKTDLFRLFLQQITVCGSAMGRREELVDLLALCDARGVRPHIDSVHALEDAAGAFERLASGHAFGKVVVTP